MTDRRPLVSAAELRGRLADPDPPIVLDIRWSLTGGGRQQYEKGHLPGAVFVDLDTDLAGPPGAGGRHPLPDPAALQAALRRAGVRENHPVVVYDAGGSPPTGAAARAWWILHWAGHHDTRVLDGGYKNWDGPTTTAEPMPEPGDITVRPGGMKTLDATDIDDSITLLDARVPARYRGEQEPVDPVAGHIPGAINLPAGETVDANGLLRLPEQVTELDGPVGAYCGSGVTAAQLVLALTVAGHEPALYVGSWSHWITDPSRPIERTVP